MGLRQALKSSELLNVKKIELPQLSGTNDRNKQNKRSKVKLRLEIGIQIGHGNQMHSSGN